MSDDWIGLRVARYRDLAGLTQQQLADRVGKSRPYISQIENGDRPVTTRKLLIALAEALGVSTVDLTGTPRHTRDRAERPVHVAVPAVRAALAGALDPLTVHRESGQLLEDVTGLMSARMACDYPRIGRLLAPTLAGATALAQDQATPEADAILSRVLFTASMVLRPLGYVDLATMMAQQAAGHAELPDARAAAEFARSQCLLAVGGQGMQELSLRVALGPADEPGPATAWKGLLYLQAGLAAASLGNDSEAMECINEAADIARLTSVVDSWQMDFSAANVEVWRVAAVLESADPGRAVDISRRVPINDLKTVQRRAHLLMHAAHGHYARGQYDSATSLFVMADRLAPAEVRGRTRVREVVGQMLRDARRRAGSEQLRDLALKVGVDPLETT
jgi:DNA-binding XRE family transcriptional regulator/tetratricopeptide (TPR) repeat protein